jgi:phage terminase Nu1 subunit (DNA packaging protein)
MVKKGRILNRSQVAQCFGVAATTIDSWVKKGCPIVSQGGKGIPSQFDTAEAFGWYSKTQVFPVSKKDTICSKWFEDCVAVM